MKKKKTSYGTAMDSAAAKKIIARRKQVPDATTLTQKLLAGDRTALARSITLIESQAAGHQLLGQQILKDSLPYSGKGIRVGITGVPGVGKSTFIESFGNLLIEEGHKIAVLTIDPSSSQTRGSILGDKTRMEKLSHNPQAFIRPSASGESLGGVAQKTREAMILCEAAGYDVVLVETVGVGQSETAVHAMTDFFLLLKLPGAGDELQGIKRGIMELADLIAINKADGENKNAAAQAQKMFAKALHLYPVKQSAWQPRATTCSALTQKGILELWKTLKEYLDLTKSNGYFTKNRKQQDRLWLKTTIEDQLKHQFYNSKKVQQVYAEVLDKVYEGELTPFQAARYLLDL